MIAKRYHDISCGHKVFGHESKCAYLHGHNYRIHFEIQGNIDSIGRVLDFSVIKEKLCNWLEENFDHRFLVFKDDPDALKLQAIDATILILNFNPTAENIARVIYEILRQKIEIQYDIEITLYETPRNYVVYPVI